VAGGTGGSGSGGSSPGSGGAGPGDAAGQGGGSGADAASETGSPGGIAAAGRLHQLLLTVKCVRQQSDGKSCFASAADEKKTESITFTGDPAVTYDVKVRVRGIVEARGYNGGMLQDPMNPWLYVGGTPGGPDARYNVYKISVSSPQTNYFLNKDHDGILASAATNHNLFKLDYPVTLKVKGGATIAVAGDDQTNSGMINNHMKNTVEGMPATLMQPFDGQFLYFDVLSVAPAAP
jgi:hypothetical protein